MPQTTQNAALPQAALNGHILADVADAVKRPLDYEVSRSVLGWTLRHIASEVCTILAPEDAQRIIGAMVLAELRADADEARYLAMERELDGYEAERLEAEARCFPGVR